MIMGKHVTLSFLCELRYSHKRFLPIPCPKLQERDIVGCQPIRFEELAVCRANCDPNTVMPLLLLVEDKERLVWLGRPHLEVAGK